MGKPLTKKEIEERIISSDDLGFYSIIGSPIPEPNTVLCDNPNTNMGYALCHDNRYILIFTNEEYAELFRSLSGLDKSRYPIWSDVSIIDDLLVLEEYEYKFINGDNLCFEYRIESSFESDTSETKPVLVDAYPKINWTNDDKQTVPGINILSFPSTDEGNAEFDKFKNRLKTNYRNVEILDDANIIFM